MIRLWWVCRSPEGDLARFPDQGAANDQACFILSAFEVLEGALAELRQEAGTASGGAGA